MNRKFSKESPSRKTFILLNYIFCGLAAFMCIIPMIHILAISLSDELGVNSGQVKLLPVNLTFSTYRYLLQNKDFFAALWISVKRVLLAVPIGMLLCVLAAYPLSKSVSQFHARKYYAAYLIIAMIFNGGLIPTYLVIAQLNLIDSIWALVLPGAVDVFSVVLMQNFFKSLPDAITEAAFMDGAGHWQTLFRIVLPLSKPVLATLTLFCAVGQWNSWFDGLIYMNRPEQYPLQSYLQTVITEVNLDVIQNVDVLQNITQKSTKSAEVFLAMVPILCVYPFLQRYFTGGIVMGSVKE